LGGKAHATRTAEAMKSVRKQHTVRIELGQTFLVEEIQNYNVGMNRLIKQFKNHAKRQIVGSYTQLRSVITTIN